ncbi:uncharacterized protein [Procambarus clarkii]|uniref:uncharacterized protein n=1 Tax=Procambarus clarkii TaxID=6728 RepID=UPI003743F2A0
MSEPGRVVKVLVRLGGYASPAQANIVDKIPSDLYVYGLRNTGKLLRSKEVKLADHKIKSDHLTDVALSQLKCQVARLNEQPDKLQQYHNLIQQQLDNKFIEVVENDNSKEGHYLPHHAILKDSITVPLRIVFNCSANVKANSVSLNNWLQTGPNLTQRRNDVLLRFHLGTYAYTTDISKAFFRVGLQKED